MFSVCQKSLPPLLASFLLVTCWHSATADERGKGRYDFRLDGMKRQKLLHQNGGNEASQEAVEKALAWLVHHQLADGSWNFDHTGGECKGRCSGKGTQAKSRIAATAIALLSLLGSGHTHKEGDYQKNVKKGLTFLVAQQKENGSLYELGGTMYSHAIAATCLCEVQAMYKTESVYDMPAQKAIDFIVASQDPKGGGWRYLPKQSGDTSVTAWQVLPLTRYSMKVPAETNTKAIEFLNSVQAEGGALYGYTTPGKGPGTTAKGLLSSFLLGRLHAKDESLKKGVIYLAKHGPSRTDAYYNMWVNQLMFEHGGEPWKKWNATLRDHLVATQATEGHEVGSWPPGSGHAAVNGGRLLTTAVSAITLETYYRHNRIFEDE